MAPSQLPMFQEGWPHHSITRSVGLLCHYTSLEAHSREYTFHLFFRLQSELI